MSETASRADESFRAAGYLSYSRADEEEFFFFSAMRELRVLLRKELEERFECEIELVESSARRVSARSDELRWRPRLRDLGDIGASDDPPKPEFFIALVGRHYFRDESCAMELEAFLGDGFGQEDLVFPLRLVPEEALPDLASHKKGQLLAASQTFHINVFRDDSPSPFLLPEAVRLVAHEVFASVRKRRKGNNAARAAPPWQAAELPPRESEPKKMERPSPPSGAAESRATDLWRDLREVVTRLHGRAPFFAGPAAPLAAIGLVFLLAQGVAKQIDSAQANQDHLLQKRRSDTSDMATALIWAPSSTTPQLLVGTRAGRILKFEGRRFVEEDEGKRGAIWAIFPRRGGAYSAIWSVDGASASEMKYLADGRPAPRGLWAADAEGRALGLAQRTSSAEDLSIDQNRRPQRAAAQTARPGTPEPELLHMFHPGVAEPQPIDASTAFGDQDLTGVWAVPADASFLVAARSGRVAKFSLDTPPSSGSPGRYAYNFGYGHAAPVVACATAATAQRQDPVIAATAGANGSIRLVAGFVPDRRPSASARAFPIDRYGPIARDGLALSAGRLLLRSQQGRLFLLVLDEKDAGWNEIVLPSPPSWAFPGEALRDLFSWLPGPGAAWAQKAPRRPPTKTREPETPTALAASKIAPPPLVAVTAVVLAPDGKMLAAAGDDGLIRVVSLADISEPRLVASIRGHGDVVTHLAISPDGRHLASASLDARLRISDLSAASRWDRWPLVDLPTGPAPRPMRAAQGEQPTTPRESDFDDPQFAKGLRPASRALAK